MKKKEGVYKKSWRFIKETNSYFLIASVIFAASILVGYLLPVFFTDFIKEFIKNILAQTEGFNFFQLFVFILQNNLMSAFIGMIAGILLGIFPVLIASLNGYVLGFVMNKTASAGGEVVLLRLLPHGVFEIPALVLSLGLGIRLGMFIFAKKKKQDLVYALENCLRVFLFVVLPLLLIAAIIEAGLVVFLG